MKGQVVEISRLFRQGSTRLVIPVYQRNYDWREKQCARLLEDLRDVIIYDRPKHFFGSVVGKNDSSWEWVVIDGQQRLTTVSLLMLALVRCINQGLLEEPHDPRLHRIERDFLRIDGDDPDDRGEPLFKLKPVKNDNLAYRRLFGPEEDFIENSRVTVNYRYFLSELPRLGLNADEIWEAITRLEVMHLDLEGSDDPQRIFESLNSTGLALTEADKIRNLILMELDNRTQTRLYEERWNPIEKNVGYRTSWFIRLFLVAQTGATPRKSEVFDRFKRYLNQQSGSSATQRERVLDELYRYSVICHGLQHATTGYPAVDTASRRANRLLGDVALPLIWRIFADLQDGEISEKEMVQVLEILETHTFRRVVCAVAANALNKIYATTYTELRKLRTKGESYPEILTYLLRRRDNTSGRIPGDEEFRAAFETRNFYNLQQSYRSYLFDTLENGHSRDRRDIAAALEAGDISVEHIMPQKLNAEWEAELVGQVEDVVGFHDQWKHRIANLTVTGYNSTYSNSSFRRKKSVEGGFDSSPYRINQELKEARSWGPEELAGRSRRLAELALKLWPLPESTFEAPTRVRPTMPLGEDTDFSKQRITAYEYDGVTETVRSWRDFMRKFIALLARDYREEIIEIAPSVPALVSAEAGSRAAIKSDTVAPGLTVTYDNSTRNKLLSLRRILEHLEIDPDDVIITLAAGSVVDSAAEEPEEDTEPNPHAELLAFLPAIEEAASLGLTLDENRTLCQEFLQAVPAVAVADPQQQLHGRTLDQLGEPSASDDASPDVAVAVVTLLAQAAQFQGLSVIHQWIVGGHLAAWLRRLG